MTLDWSYCSNFDCKDTKCDRNISNAPEGELVSMQQKTNAGTYIVRAAKARSYTRIRLLQ